MKLNKFNRIEPQRFYALFCKSYFNFRMIFPIIRDNGLIHKHFKLTVEVVKQINNCFPYPRLHSAHVATMVPIYLSISDLIHDRSTLNIEDCIILSASNEEFTEDIQQHSYT